MEPMIKYRGGKSKEIASFQKFIPADYGTYLEPFLGGGAVYFRLEPRKAVVNDINPRLMCFYRDVRDDYARLRKELDGLQETYDANQAEYEAEKAKHPDERVPNKNERLYYEIRDMYNGRTPSPYLDGTLYFFINKTAFSGMIRYNSEGEYNVPFGRYRSFNAKAITEEHSRLLRRSEVLNGDYSEVFSMAGEDDFMFLDPPYDCIFHDYGNIGTDGFDDDQHRRLAEAYKKLKCRALLVIGKTELTEKLYEGYIRGEYHKSYAVNIRNRFRSEASHMIVTNYEIG